MNNPDYERFIEVFVDLRKEGSPVPYSPDYYEYILKQIPSYILEYWKAFLKKKADIMGDDFFDWYDELTFDAIDSRDLYSFRLPEEPIMLPVGLDVDFVLKVHGILTDWFNSCDITDEDPAAVYIKFSDTIITASFEILTGLKRSKVSALKDSFKEALNAIQLEIARFNEYQGKKNVNIEKTAHLENRKDEVAPKAFKTADGTLIKTEIANSLAISTDDLFVGKHPADPEYVKRFFSIISDEQSKGGSVDVDLLSQKEFAEITGKEYVPAEF